MRAKVVLALVVAAFGAGCGRQAIATTDALPVQRVVVYRNGVAYFEREGHVDGDEVRFKMKQTEVGDFLATLAVMERGGSSVRAAAFPLKVDDENDEAKEPHPGGHEEATEDEKTRSGSRRSSCRSTARRTTCKSATSPSRPCGGRRTGWSSTPTGTPTCKRGESSRTSRARTGRT